MIRPGAQPGVVRLDRDRLNSVQTEVVAQAAMKVVDTMQSYRPEVVVAGIAAAFLLLAQAHRLDPADAARVASNVIFDSQGRPIPEFRAVLRYLREET